MRVFLEVTTPQHVGVPCFFNVIYPGAFSRSLLRKLPDYKVITTIIVYPITGYIIPLLIDMYCYIDSFCPLHIRNNTSVNNLALMLLLKCSSISTGRDSKN